MEPRHLLVHSALLILVMNSPFSWAWQSCGWGGYTKSSYVAQDVSPSDPVPPPFYVGGGIQATADPNIIAFEACYDGTCGYSGSCTSSGQCPSGQKRNPVTGFCVPSAKNSGNPKCNGVGNPINAGAGNKFQAETDFSNRLVPGFGLTRFYNSSSWPGSPVLRQVWGMNWRSNYDFAVVAESPEKNTLYRPDGRAITFTLNADQQWAADSDISSSLQALSDGGWLYTNDESGEKEYYASSGRISSISKLSNESYFFIYSDGTAGVNGGYVLDVNGNATSKLLPANLLIRVTDGFGRSISFGYDQFKHVTKVVSASGQAYRYSYDSRQNLSAVVYPDGSERQYIYNEIQYTGGISLPHALTGIVDENGQRFATYQYDSQGRSIATEHGSGVDKVSLVYAVDSGGNIASAIVTDALNTSRTQGFINILGVPRSVGVSQSCPGCGASSSKSYDSSGNLSSRTDFNGRVTNYAYDLARNLEVSRIEASDTSAERVTGTTWHADFRLPMTITESGKVASFSYDTNGNLLSMSVTSVPQ